MCWRGHGGWGDSGGDRRPATGFGQSVQIGIAIDQLSLRFRSSGLRSIGSLGPRQLAVHAHDVGVP